LPAPAEVIVVMMLEGVDYDAIVANTTLQSALVDQIQASLADAANVSKSAVSVVLTKGSVVVTASIQTRADQFDAMMSHLGENSTQSALATEARLAASGVPHMDLVTASVISVNGSITVDSLSTRSPTPLPSPSGPDLARESDTASAFVGSPVLLAFLFMTFQGDCIM